LWSTDYSVHSFFQITKHWSNNEKPEMTLERLQPIATAVAAPPHTVEWLQNWTSSFHTHEAFHFPSKGFVENELEASLNKASFWIGIRNHCPCALPYVYFFTTLFGNDL
jgi:hypothetical protein